MKSFRSMNFAISTLALAVTMNALAQNPSSLEKTALARVQAQPQPPAQAAPESDLFRLQAELKSARDRLSDWPNLGRYRDANAQAQPPARGEKRVVFMGDSITEGWGGKYGKFFSGKPYLNRGISGQTTPQILIRFRPDVIALHPKVVVILAGTNDLAGNTGPTTLEAIEDNLISMAELAKVNGIRVVLASLLPVSDYLRPQTERRPPQKIVALNQWIKDYAAKNGFVYLDYYAAMLDDKKMLKQGLTYDGLHPNDAGYEIMAPLAQEAIAQALRAEKGPAKRRAWRR